MYVFKAFGKHLKIDDACTSNYNKLFTQFNMNSTLKSIHRLNCICAFAHPLHIKGFNLIGIGINNKKVFSMAVNHQNIPF